MWISVGVMIAATLAGQDPAPEGAAPERRYGQLRAAADAELARRAGTEAATPRLTVSQRLERDCAPDIRAADETEIACRERVTEAAIQESLTRGGTTDRTGGWTEAEERRWVEAPARNPMDRLRDCRQSTQRSRDGESSSWSIRCGDRDGPAAQALDRLLDLD